MVDMTWLEAQWVAVYPNLIASAICTGVVWLRLHVHFKRQHAQAEARHAEVVRELQTKD